MSIVTFRYVILLVLLLPAAAGRAQTTAAADTAFLATAVTQAQQRYEAVSGQLRPLTGAEYVDYTRSYAAVQGNQFFGNPEQQPSTVTYNGYQFAAVPVQYDLRFDQLIVRKPNTPFALKLVGEKVQAFSLQGHSFVRLNTEQVAGQPLSPGFYDVMLDTSNVRFLVKRIKRLQEQAVSQTLIAYFSVADRYFLQLGSAYYPLSGKASVVRLFEPQKKALQKYAQTQGLKFKPETRETDLLQLLGYGLSLGPPTAPAAGH
ncbi:hypothetical protein [Hymenobacter chitinivorans]|uniref:Outer membrane lipoprotein-sorting protein n=1 Tax=Hymenobacter chitinivorans DSM 11115 TaxID=1121954 RepID=A0A2M9B5H8_9BACT|nr:hypothetical protein [Hymenobacter chitinivorans]PJJ53195.1 hypothetical protein CLV45_3853 [Hymenobacter chitinivorans DSM 11115]